MIVVAIFILGLCLGSFINALVWRIHEKKPIANDRSECPNCGHKLNALDLIPVISWVLLRGHCRYCKKSISLQYPVIELLTGLLLAISYQVLTFSTTIDYLLFAIWALELVILIALAVYDLKWMLLPNILMIWVAIIASIGVILHLNVRYALNALAAALIAGSFFWFLHTISKGKWMGGGDIKLAFVMGLILGGSRVIVAMFFAFNAAAIVGIILIISGRFSRKSLMPFGPFLIGGTIVSMVWGQLVVDWYLRIIGFS